MCPQPRNHDEDAPQAENHAGHGGQHFDERDERLPNPERRQLGQINRGGDAQRHGDEQRDERRYQRAVDERQRAELLLHRIPRRSGEKLRNRICASPATNRAPVASRQDDQHHHRQRHRQRQPLERAVAKARRRRQSLAAATLAGSAQRRTADRLHGWSFRGSIRRSPSALHFDFVDALQHALLQALRQRRVIQILGHFFAVLGRAHFRNSTSFLPLAASFCCS